MGEYKDRSGIRCFSPDDTDTEFYINCDYESQSLLSILEVARKKWGYDLDINAIKIEAEYIHTHCLGYDSYDPGDYTRYLRIEYTTKL